ncbi:MAG: formylmethanofuran dehydrogenase subunit E family protein [Spirochaetes bacterium]|jgi:formylmethanofuran dehydrogenase subunit E|nr:formylmethanofuran dehydrogenase subunit E family protein [Spirochaetota bacterium]
MDADKKTVTIGGRSIDEYIAMVTGFHGSFAPGLLLGGFMVEHAMRNLPPGEFFDVICETSHCLPDAVQLLTPCSIGNGWLRIIDVGRFAMTFYDKRTGSGVRVYLDHRKLEPWNEIKNWFFRLKPKSEQSRERLIDEMVRAGEGVLGARYLSVKKEYLAHRHGGAISLCPECGEAYPSEHGERCRACQGALPYDDGPR